MSIPASQIRVWNFDLPPFPREGLFHLEMSEFCQINRLLKFEAGRLAHLHQLDIFEDEAQLKEFQKNLRRALWEKIGICYDNSLPLDVHEYGTVQKEGFSIKKLIYQSQQGIYVTALLYIPDGKGPFPAVLQMHGHNPDGKFGLNVQSTSLGLVKSGFVVLAVDAAGTYERAEECYVAKYHGGTLGAHFFNIGESLMGVQIADNMRGVDLLRTLPFVIKDKIGATGASGGGNQTMWLAALDERIAAAMPVVSVGSFESYVYGVNCMCEVLPDGLTMTEESGVLALIAPRPLRIGNALYDCNHDFSIAQMLKTYHPVEKIYWNLGYPERISFNVADRVHGMHDRQRESVLGFFAQTLKGEGNGNPLPEPEYDICPEEELRLFASPEQRPPEVMTIPAYLQKKGVKLRQNYLAQVHIDREKAVADLKELIHLPDSAPCTLHRYAAVKGVGRFAVESGVHLIPFLSIPGKEEGKYTILLHPEGKKKITQAEIEQAAQDGSTVILPDLFGCGETGQESIGNTPHHQYYRQLLWIGHTLIGEWTADVLSLAKTLKEEFKARQISVHALRESGGAALFANIFSKDIDSMVLINAPSSLLYDCRSSSEPYSLILSTPRFLQWGDLSLAVALGNGECRFVSPCTSGNVPLTAEQKELWQTEISNIRMKLAAGTAK